MVTLSYQKPYHGKSSRSFHSFRSWRYKINSLSLTLPLCKSRGNPGKKGLQYPFLVVQQLNGAVCNSDETVKTEAPFHNRISLPTQWP